MSSSGSLFVGWTVGIFVHLSFGWRTFWKIYHTHLLTYLPTNCEKLKCDNTQIVNQLKLWQNRNRDKPHNTAQLILRQNWNCDKNKNLIPIQLWQISKFPRKKLNCDKTKNSGKIQLVTKLKFAQNLICDRTQILTKLNLWFLWTNHKSKL